MDVSGRMVLLTGASGGMGRAIAQQLAAEGARLLLTGRDAVQLTGLERELAADTVTLAADIATASGRRLLVDAAAAAGVEIVIHNAGVQDFGLFQEQDSAALQCMLELNLCAPVLLSRELLPMLQRHDEAALVFVGSAFGSIGHPGFAVYCASKFGLRGFAESLRRELADGSVRVHYLAPRATRTELNSSSVVALNETFGTAMDEPSLVAGELMVLLADNRGAERFIGWPEKLFVRINGVWPRIVDAALAGKLSTIRRFAARETPDRRTDP